MSGGEPGALPPPHPAMAMEIAAAKDAKRRLLTDPYHASTRATFRAATCRRGRADFGRLARADDPPRASVVSGAENSSGDRQSSLGRHTEEPRSSRRVADQRVTQRAIDPGRHWSAVGHGDRERDVDSRRVAARPVRGRTFRSRACIQIPWRPRSVQRSAESPQPDSASAQVWSSPFGSTYRRAPL
jgi:hypothetical protein